MRQKRLFNLILVLTIAFATNAQVFDFALANKTESDNFVASLPANFGSTGTISSGQWGGQYGVKVDRNSSLYYTATGLAAGDYEMKGLIMIQNTGNLAWIQDMWETGGTEPTPILQSGTSGTYVTYTETVTVGAIGNVTFSILRNNTGGQLYIKEWSVTSASAGPSTATDITGFTLPQQTGGATIDADAHAVAIQVAYGTGLASLTPTVSLSAGATVNPLSGVAQDFTNPVTYTVTAEDGTTMQDWTVSVTAAAASTTTDITAFSLAEQTGDATIDTDAHTVAIEVAYGTVVSALTPTITLSNGATVNPNTGVAQDFSSAVSYTVTAQDGVTQQIWSVTVSEAAASTETDIAAFSLADQTGNATIDTDAHTVATEVLNGSNMSSLTPTISLSTGATITPDSGVAQDFSGGAVAYTVTAQDGTTQQVWNVTVSEAAAVSGGPILDETYDSDYILDQSWPANSRIYTPGSTADAGVTTYGTLPSYYGYVTPTYTNGSTTPLWMLQGYLTMGAPNNAQASAGEDTWFTYTVSGLTVGENYILAATIEPTGAWANISYTLWGWKASRPADGYVVSNALITDPDNDVEYTLYKTLTATAETMTIGIGAGKSTGNYYHKTRIKSWSMEVGIVTDIAKKAAQVSSIYPNPARSYIQIDGLDAALSTVSIYDVSGKKSIKSVENGRVNIEDLTPGFYFIKTPNNQTLKFSKTK